MNPSPVQSSMSRRSIWRRIRSRPWLAGLGALFSVFLLFNGLAILHAYSFTHFSADGRRKQAPEDLSFGRKAGILIGGLRIARPRNVRTPADVGLRFETARFSASDGTMLEAWITEPETPWATVALFHGYADSKQQVLPEASALHALGATSLLVDFRGSGGSDGDETTIGWNEALDVEAAANFARQRWPERPVFLYGVSMGAAAVLRAAAEGMADADGIVLVAPFDRMLSTIENRFDILRAPSFPAAPLLVFWGGALNGFWAFGHNPIEYAASIRCPALALQGAEDTRATLPQVRAVFDRLAGPKRLEIFPGAVHESLILADPSRWEKAVGEFLGEYSGAGHPVALTAGDFPTDDPE